MKISSLAKKAIVLAFRSFHHTTLLQCSGAHPSSSSRSSRALFWNVTSKRAPRRGTHHLPKEGLVLLPSAFRLCAVRLLSGGRQQPPRNYDWFELS